MGHQVFISYASADKADATSLCDLLESHGISCWMAHRNIRTGVWARAISDAIDSASLMVLILSANANASAHIEREVERADRRKLPVVPVRIEDVEPGKGIGYFISNVQWIDVFPDDLETYWPTLSFAINQELGRAQTVLRLKSPFAEMAADTANVLARGTRRTATLPKRLMLGISGLVIGLGVVAGLVLGPQPLKEGICSLRTFGFCDAPATPGDDGSEGLRLAGAKFDETALTALVRDAKTTSVRGEARRRLEVIVEEQKSYEAVENDVDGLLRLLSEPCEACLVRDRARTRLKALVEASDQASEQQIEIRERDRLDRVKFDAPELEALARDAKTPAARDEARRRLDVITAEQKGYEAVENDIDGLERLLSKPCEACLLRDKAKERLNALIEARDRESAQAGAEREENHFWDSAQQSNLPEDYRAYLDRYPNGRYAPLARNRIGKSEVGTPQTEKSLALTPAKLKEVQKGLASLGYNPGAPTGTLNDTTREAIKAWQNASKFLPTGWLGPRQYAALVKESIGPRPRPPAQVTPKPLPPKIVTPKADATPKPSSRKDVKPPSKSGSDAKTEKPSLSKRATNVVTSPSGTRKPTGFKPTGKGQQPSPMPTLAPAPAPAPALRICIIGPLCL
jgi:peptidoglycan hydrolase-like protein with peptidoglycan-binding domain/triphosphoribosyl-dephospho-CoA synthetase